MADKKKDKKGNAKEKSITDILSESRNVLYGENVELTFCVNKCINIIRQDGYQTIRYRT